VEVSMAQTISHTQIDRIRERIEKILDHLFPQPRPFGIHLWDGSELPATGQPAFYLVLKHPAALRRMFSPPVELSIAAAFIYDDFDIQGDIFSTFSLMDGIARKPFKPGEVIDLARDLFSLPRFPVERALGRGPAILRGAQHSRERDRAAIQYHYDVGNDFYALWLDPASAC
jgi:cyclopropane-fatty-acyl-phospholipid synthase